MIPSAFNLTTKQIETLQSEGQNVGIPFYIDDLKACRPKGKRSNIRYVSSYNFYMSNVIKKFLNINLNLKNS